MTTPFLPDLTEEAAASAAKWWADHIRNRTRKDNGEPMHGLFAEMATKNVVVDEEHVSKFEAALMAEILSPNDRDGKPRVSHFPRPVSRIGYEGAHQGVDYGPNQVLCNAINATGETPKRGTMNTNGLAALLPWKTNLRISPVCVGGAAGYHADSNLVWKAFDKHSVLEFDVVDRWRTTNRWSGAAEWQNGGREDAKVAWITLSDEYVNPTPIALVLRGRVDVEGHGTSVENDIAYAFRNDAGAGGYLALVVPKGAE